MAALPTGVVTFLFTDVEGSTRLLQEHTAEIGPALEQHHRLLAGAIEAAGGVVFETVGDAVYGAFAVPADAIRAAVAIQRSMARTDWGKVGSLRVRIAAHSGPVQTRGDHYFGAALFEAARLQALAHGGQTLTTATTMALARGAVEAGIAFTDLGRQRLKDLQESVQVFQVDAIGLPSEFPPLRSRSRSSLPAQASIFRGRQAEMVAISSAFATGHRIVTLTGPGGVGKTRLAIEWVSSVEHDYPDGAAWVDISSARDPAAVLTLIAAAVGAGGDAIAALEHWRGLLVLDNLEQVVEAAGEIARALRSCPGLVILATSREPLRIAGERPIDVPGLDRDAAVALFRDRMAGGSDVDASAEATIRAICGLLDDQPLAIELAASRSRAMSIGAIKGRLVDRLALLSAGDRDAPERHRSLRATIAWSYELLTPAARDALGRLAVFGGGWTAEAAAAVCGVDVDSLSELVDKSLVRRSGDRFGMLQAIHEFAADILDGLADRSALELAHGRYFADRGAHLEPGALEDTGTFEHLADDGPNLALALERATARGDTDVAWTIIDGSWRVWLSTGQLEVARPFVERAVAMPPSGHEDAAERMRGMALDAAGELARFTGDLHRARTLKSGALELAQRSAAQGWIASLEHDLAWIEADLGRHDEARRHAETSLALRRAAGNPDLIVHGLDAVAGAARARGDLELASVTWHEALELMQGHESSATFAYIGLDLAETLRAMGDMGTATRFARDGLQGALNRNDFQLVMIGLEVAAALAHSSGDVQLVPFLVGALERRFAETGLTPNRRPTHEAVVAEVRGRHALAAIVDEGRSAPFGVVVERAMTWLVDASDRAGRPTVQHTGAIA